MKIRFPSCLSRLYPKNQDPLKKTTLLPLICALCCFHFRYTYIDIPSKHAYFAVISLCYVIEWSKNIFKKAGSKGDALTSILLIVEIWMNISLFVKIIFSRITSLLFSLVKPVCAIKLSVWIWEKTIKSFVVHSNVNSNSRNKNIQ